MSTTDYWTDWTTSSFLSLYLWSSSFWSCCWSCSRRVEGCTPRPWPRLRVDQCDHNTAETAGELLSQEKWEEAEDKWLGGITWCWRLVTMRISVRHSHKLKHCARVFFDSGSGLSVTRWDHHDTWLSYDRGHGALVWEGPLVHNRCPVDLNLMFGAVKSSNYNHMTHSSNVVWFPSFH